MPPARATQRKVLAVLQAVREDSDPGRYLGQQRAAVLADLKEAETVRCGEPR